MSLLWSGMRKMKLLTYLMKPSPTNQNTIQDSARNPEIFQTSYSNAACFIEGISLFISRSENNLNGCEGSRGLNMLFKRFISRCKACLGVLLKNIPAGMTVEASILLPLFLFFFLNLGCAIEMIRLHGNLQIALWETGSKLSIYGYALDSGEKPTAENGEGSWWKSIIGTTVASVYVKSQLIDILGKDYLNQSPLTRGVDGLRFWESEVLGSEDTIDIVVTYSVSPWSRLIGFSPFYMANRYYSHIWNGYQLPETKGEDVRTVYMTENGTVYHLNQNCTHLQLSVRRITAAELGGVRNQYGRRYQPCEKCTDGNRPKEFYITEEGSHFHYSRDCSGLKRTIYAVSLKDAAGYRPCSRCR